MLIIQLDSDRLENQGLDLAAFADAVAGFMPPEVSRRIRATTFESLLVELASVHGRRFDVVAVIGHSNENGMVLGSGRSVDTWAAFAGYLKPLAPRRLVLVACRAGRAIPSRVLFAALPTLRRIFATPVLANRLQGEVMIGLLPHILGRPVPSRSLLRIAQAGLGLLAGRQLWEWRRTDYDRNKHDPFSPIFEDVVADLGDALLAGVRRTARTP